MGGKGRKKSLHTQSSLISLLYCNKEDVDFHTSHHNTHTDQKAAFFYITVPVSNTSPVQNAVKDAEESI